jgi:hypothetical protein
MAREISRAVNKLAWIPMEKKKKEEEIEPSVEY